MTQKVRRNRGKSWVFRPRHPIKKSLLTTKMVLRPRPPPIHRHHVLSESERIPNHPIFGGFSEFLNARFRVLRGKIPIIGIGAPVETRNGTRNANVTPSCPNNWNLQGEGHNQPHSACYQLLVAVALRQSIQCCGMCGESHLE